MMPSQPKQFGILPWRSFFALIFIGTFAFSTLVYSDSDKEGEEQPTQIEPIQATPEPGPEDGAESEPEPELPQLDLPTLQQKAAELSKKLTAIGIQVSSEDLQRAIGMHLSYQLQQRPPIVAIVGMANGGSSTLFNVIANESSESIAPLSGEGPSAGNTKAPVVLTPDGFDEADLKALFFAFAFHWDLTSPDQPASYDFGNNDTWGAIKKWFVDIPEETDLVLWRTSGSLPYLLIDGRGLGHADVTEKLENAYFRNTTELADLVLVVVPQNSRDHRFVSLVKELHAANKRFAYVFNHRPLETISSGQLNTETSWLYAQTSAWPETCYAMADDRRIYNIGPKANSLGEPILISEDLQSHLPPDAERGQEAAKTALLNAMDRWKNSIEANQALLRKLLTSIHQSPDESQLDIPGLLEGPIRDVLLEAWNSQRSWRSWGLERAWGRIKGAVGNARATGERKLVKQGRKAAFQQEELKIFYQEFERMVRNLESLRDSNEFSGPVQVALENMTNASRVLDVWRRFEAYYHSEKSIAPDAKKKAKEIMKGWMDSHDISAKVIRELDFTGELVKGGGIITLGFATNYAVTSVASRALGAFFGGGVGTIAMLATTIFLPKVIVAAESLAESFKRVPLGFFLRDVVQYHLNWRWNWFTEWMLKNYLAELARAIDGGNDLLASDALTQYLSSGQTCEALLANPEPAPASN